MASEETYNIDITPFIGSIEVAIEELLSIHNHPYGNLSADDIVMVISYLERNMVSHLIGEEVPRLSDQDIHEFGTYPDSMREYLYYNLAAGMGCYILDIKRDPLWVDIIEKIVNTFAHTYREVFPIAAVA